MFDVRGIFWGGSGGVGCWGWGRGWVGEGWMMRSFSAWDLIWGGGWSGRGGTVSDVRMGGKEGAFGMEKRMSV